MSIQKKPKVNWYKIDDIHICTTPEELKKMNDIDFSAIDYVVEESYITKKEFDDMNKERNISETPDKWVVIKIENPKSQQTRS